MTESEKKYKIIDCFTFFNELDLLEGRLEYLNDVVDYFIIVESDTTFSGNPKPLNYLHNAKRYQKYLHKILYFPQAADLTGLDFKTIDHCDYQSPPWQLEYSQRNYIGNALKFFSDDDIVLVSDLDEIPRKEAIEFGIERLGTVAEAFGFYQQMFFYNFLHRQTRPCAGTVLTTNKFLQTHSAQWLRDMRSHIPMLSNAGWHLSFWGDPAKIELKIRSFAHQEVNKDRYTNHNEISRRIVEGKDPFDRQTLEAVDVDTLPKDIYNIFSKYAVS